MKDQAAGLRRRTFLSEEVAAYLRQRIVDGGYLPGQYIRVTSLAAELGVSPTPVREALMALWQQGFLEQLPRRGFRVAPLTKRDILDLFEMLAFIGGELAARAAVRLNDEALDQLSRLLSRLRALEKNGSASQVDSLDHEFHWLVYEAAESPKLLWFMNLGYHYVPHAYFASKSYRTHSAAGHLELLDALRMRDEVGARRAMARHLRYAGTHLAAEIGTDGTPI